MPYPKTFGQITTPTSSTNKNNDKIFAQAAAQDKYNKERARLLTQISQTYSANSPEVAIQIQKQKEIIRNAENTISLLAVILQTQLAIQPPTTQSQTLVSQALADQTAAKKQILDAKATLKSIDDKIKASEKDRAKLTKDLKKLTKAGVVSTNTNNNNNNGNNGNGKGEGSSELAYKYNAPMVKSAYIQGIQAYLTPDPNLITSPGAYSNARQAWGDGKPAKGAIQMSTRFADVSVASQNGKKGLQAAYVDKTNYGFKFLYNPQSVSMAWGIVEQFSPQFEASGQDRASGISVGLMKSAITFSLMLNRIGDMTYLNDKNAFNRVNTSTLAGIQQASESIATDIYPAYIDPEELRLIYERGTMYDLEYLFRTTNGYNATYNATVLGGRTADKGWLMPIPVELHLGKGLRYLVRISQLDVQHIIFDSRMVPILTTVNVTCTRYYDGPEMYRDSETGSTLLNTLDVFGTKATIDPSKSGTEIK